jgi:ribosomal protein L37AE/L43A
MPTEGATMNSTTIIKTQFEYSMMPQQNYEFECQGCFTLKTIRELATGSILGTWYCEDCGIPPHHVATW